MTAFLTMLGREGKDAAALRPMPSRAQRGKRETAQGEIPAAPGLGNVLPCCWVISYAAPERLPRNPARNHADTRWNAAC